MTRIQWLQGNVSQRLHQRIGCSPHWVCHIMNSQSLFCNCVNSLLSEADFVVDILPATASTNDFFDRSRFGQFKSGAVFINVGRGNSVDEAALVAALESGQLAGAGLDVTKAEPLPEDSALWAAPNLLLTPHIAGPSEMYVDRAVGAFCENLRAFIAGRDMPQRIDRERGY